MLFVCIYYVATNSKRLPISDTLSQPALFFFIFVSKSHIRWEIQTINHSDYGKTIKEDFNYRTDAA